VSLLADTTPLRTADFRRLWSSGVVTVIGANLTIFAAPVRIYALTRNFAYVGLSGLFALVPLIVFGLSGAVAGGCSRAGGGCRRLVGRAGVSGRRRAAEYTW
jgi:hypothetical protein